MEIFYRNFYGHTNFKLRKYERNRTNKIFYQ